MRQLLYKPKDRVTTKDKNDTIFEIDYSNCEAVYVGKPKRYLEPRFDEQKRFVNNCDCEKNEIAKHCSETYYNFS